MNKQSSWGIVGALLASSVAQQASNAYNNLPADASFNTREAVCRVDFRAENAVASHAENLARDFAAMEVFATEISEGTARVRNFREQSGGISAALCLSDESREIAFELRELAHKLSDMKKNQAELGTQLNDARAGIDEIARDNKTITEELAKAKLVVIERYLDRYHAFLERFECDLKSRLRALDYLSERDVTFYAAKWRVVYTLSSLESSSPDSKERKEFNRNRDQRIDEVSKIEPGTRKAEQIVDMAEDLREAWRDSLTNPRYDGPSISEHHYSVQLDKMCIDAEKAASMKLGFELAKTLAGQMLGKYGGPAFDLALSPLDRDDLDGHKANEEAYDKLEAQRVFNEACKYNRTLQKEASSSSSGSGDSRGNDRDRGGPSNSSSGGGSSTGKTDPGSSKDPGSGSKSEGKSGGSGRGNGGSHDGGNSGGSGAGGTNGGGGRMGDCRGGEVNGGGNCPTS